MIIFHNPGLIDLAATVTMGVSVKTPGSFGRFGTGFKYAVARILRGGGKVTILRGLDRHVFASIPSVIRGESFDLVTLDGVSCGFTTLLGKDWEPWQALRELGCNARDEGGDFHYSETGRVKKAADRTYVIVDSRDIDEAFQDVDELFVTGEPICETPKIKVRPGPSDFIYYRGVRVYKTPKPCLFSYDITEEIRLTEDRTVANIYEADVIIRRAFLKIDDVETVKKFISASSQYYESDALFSLEYDPEPSIAFIESAVATRNNPGTILNNSVKQLLLKRMRKASGEKDDNYAVAANYHDDCLQNVIGLLAESGFKFAPDQKFVMAEELPGESLSMLEGGIVFFTPAFLASMPHVIARELISRWVDLTGHWSVDQIANAIANALINHIGYLSESADEADSVTPPAFVVDEVF